MLVHAEGDKSYTYGGRFTGPVELEMIIEAARSGDPDIARVHFHDGAVTNWHAHPGGQVLVLLTGTGRVGAGEDAHTGLQPGVVVETPADEPHWHGADTDADAIWLAITWGVTDWHERAPDLQP